MGLPHHCQDGGIGGHHPRQRRNFAGSAHPNFRGKPAMFLGQFQQSPRHPNIIVEAFGTLYTQSPPPQSGGQQTFGGGLSTRSRDGGGKSRPSGPVGGGQLTQCDSGVRNHQLGTCNWAAWTRPPPRNPKQWLVRRDHGHQIVRLSKPKTTGQI